MKQIILDTETTGISAEAGHRIIELGAIEIVDRKITDNNFQAYLNPKRNIDPGSIHVHGITDEFVSDKFSDEICFDLSSNCSKDSIISCFLIGMIEFRVLRIEYT